MSTTSTVAILRNLRSLVGNVEFEKALASLSSEPVGADAPLVGKAKKERKPRKENPEMTLKRKRAMAALQAFTQTVREEMGKDTEYKTVQKEAGDRWKALTEEQKKEWLDKVPEPSTSDSEGEKTVTVTLVEPVKEPKVAVTAVKAEAEESKEAEAEAEPAPKEPKKLVAKKAGRPTKKEEASA